MYQCEREKESEREGTRIYLDLVMQEADVAHCFVQDRGRIRLPNLHRVGQGLKGPEN